LEGKWFAIGIEVGIITQKLSDEHNLSRFSSSTIGCCPARYGGQTRMLERDAAVNGATSCDI